MYSYKKLSDEEFHALLNTILAPGTTYRFGQQGQFAEKDNETGWNAFEARMWDSKIGRWNSIDPRRQFWSPYLGMGNSPVGNIDPDGRFKTRFGAWLYKLINGGDEIEFGEDKGEWFVGSKVDLEGAHSGYERIFKYSTPIELIYDISAKGNVGIQTGLDLGVYGASFNLFSVDLFEFAAKGGVDILNNESWIKTDRYVLSRYDESARFTQGISLEIPTIVNGLPIDLKAGTKGTISNRRNLQFEEYHYGFGTAFFESVQTHNLTNDRVSTFVGTQEDAGFKILGFGIKFNYRLGVKITTDR